jgi:hypothetical protein
MSYGVTHDPGGLMAPADVPYAGASEWERLTGVTAMSPLVGGPGLTGSGMPYNVDGARSRIVSNDAATVDPMHGPGVDVLDTWRDVFNFRGSPVPWLLIGILIIVGFMHLRVEARAGRARGNIALG